MRELLGACGADLGRLRRELKEFIDDSRRVCADEDELDVQPTLGFQRVLQRAVFHVQSSGRKEVDGVNVLVAIFSEKQSQARVPAGPQDVDRLDSSTSCRTACRRSPRRRPDRTSAAGARERDGEGGSALETYTTQPQRSGAGRARSIR